MTDFRKELIDLIPSHDYFIGIDSDGCVFDTMEVKQKKFFIPNALKHFGLNSIEKPLRTTWEFVNLYSLYRGGNRFISLIKVFELLGENPEVRASGCSLPDMTSLKNWIKTETRLGNSTLRKYFESNYNPDLEKVVSWSEAINEEIALHLGNIPPFPNALSGIKKAHVHADLVIVSQTPLEALQREWEENNLRKYVKLIAAQEHGTKSEHLAYAAKGKYNDNKILMIGDAKGDLDAAKANGIHFFPVIPGREDKSWEVFNNVALNRFLTDTYCGKFEDDLIKEFMKALPDKL
ncbi:MAG: HAD hydrolase-like protein [Bacteroidales bacterium]|nr:HAD hydrolase-like protein [Bacteroidales bacterium]